MQEFLSWGEFINYMDKFKAEFRADCTDIKANMNLLDKSVKDLGREVSELQGRVEGKGNGTYNGPKQDHVKTLIEVVKYVLVLLAGGFMALGGASWGQNILNMMK